MVLLLQLVVWLSCLLLLPGVPAWLVLLLLRSSGLLLHHLLLQLVLLQEGEEEFPLPCIQGPNH